MKMLDMPGKVAVMVRYQGRVAVYQRRGPARCAGREPARREELRR